MKPEGKRIPKRKLLAETIATIIPHFSTHSSRTLSLEVY